MKVKDLVARLQQEDGEMDVVTDLHSEFAHVTAVMRIVAREQGGYVSRPYVDAAGQRDLLAHGYLYIGAGSGR